MRKDPTLKQRNEVFAFYGEMCIVRGEINKNEIDIAHIDDNPANTVFENLLPLQSGLNQALSRSKNMRANDLPEELFPEFLAGKAWVHFREGKYAASYGCNRLACHLAITRHNDYNFAIDCLNYCIGALRPIAQKYLLNHIFFLVPLIMEKSPEPIDPFWKGEFLGKVGLVLFDFNKIDLSNRFQQEAQVFYQKSLNKPWKRDIELKIAASLRRYALVNFDNTTIDKLIELEEIFRKRGDFTGEATTLHVKAILQLELQGDINKTMDILEKMKSLESKTKNPWVVAELHLLLGRVYILLRDKKKAKDEFEISRQLFVKHKIIPEPSRNVGPLDPSIELRKLGINIEGSLHNRGDLFLPEKELIDILKRVKGSP